MENIQVTNCIVIIIIKVNRCIDKSSGSYNCSNCGSHGSWYDLKQAFGDIKSINNLLNTFAFTYIYIGSESSGISNSKKLMKISSEDIELFRNQLFAKEEFKEVLEYLVEECKICEETLNKYNVGACNGTFYKDNEKVIEKCVLFPYIDCNNENNIKKMRLLSVEDKSHEKYVINNGSEGLFGWTKRMNIYMFN